MNSPSATLKMVGNVGGGGGRGGLVERSPQRRVTLLGRAFSVLSISEQWRYTPMEIISKVETMLKQLEVRSFGKSTLLNVIDSPPLQFCVFQVARKPGLAEEFHSVMRSMLASGTKRNRSSGRGMLLSRIPPYPTDMLAPVAADGRILDFSR